MNIFMGDEKLLIASLTLLTIGIIGFVVGDKNKRKNNVNANNGSVAIGGDNNAPINIKNANQKNELPNSSSVSWSIWNIICGIATLLGLILTIIPFIKKG